LVDLFREVPYSWYKDPTISTLGLEFKAYGVQVRGMFVTTFNFYSIKL